MPKREMIQGGYRLRQNIGAMGQVPPLSKRTLKRRATKLKKKKESVK